MTKRILAIVCTLLLAFSGLSVTPAFGQIVTPRGKFYAADYGKWVSQTASNSAASAASITVSYGTVNLSDTDSRPFTPFSTPPTGGARPSLLVDDGTPQETVVPTGSSSCGSGGPLGACTVVGTFTNAHGRGARITSATRGLQEALNDAISSGGGVVVVDRTWANLGGTTAMITALAAVSMVSIEDLRGATPVYYYMQPTTLTALATPATRSAAAGATQVIDGTAVGTWANAPLYVAVTYVDALGGESPASASFNFTPAGSLATNWASPAASTGAVGWRAYAGITGTSTMYQLPITSANCTLSTLVSTITACAIGAAAVFTTPLTTSSLAPGYVVNVYRPNTQSHTTFAYVASPVLPPGAFQSNYGPFIATGNIAAGQVGVLGTVPLPTGYLNQIGKSIQIRGKIVSTAANTAVQGYQVSLGPTFTTGTPTVLCQFTNTVTLAAVAYGTSFECTLTTNATGASGTIMPNGFAITQAAAGGATALSIGVDTATAAITNAINGQNSIYIVLTTGTAATNPAQLVDLHIVPLN